MTGSPALGETARGVAKGLPIRLLHGGSHAAWLAAHGLVEEYPMFPLMVQLERELRGCRREVYRYMGRHARRGVATAFPTPLSSDNSGSGETLQ